MSLRLRSDVSRADRLQTFTDATIAIIATIQIGTMTRTETSSWQDGDKDGDVDCNLYCYLKSRGVAIAVYFLGFFLVSGLWTGLVRLFRSVCHTDDVLLTLKLFTIGVMSFLPLAVGLLASYPAESLAVYLTCIVIAIETVVELVIVMYVFRKARADLLYDNVDILFTRRGLVITEIAKLVVCGLVALVNIGSQDAAIVILVGMFFIPLAVKILENYMKHGLNMQLFPTEYFKEIVQKDRLEFFSDGVFSISATLILLDVSTEVVPNQSQVSLDGFSKSLMKEWTSLVAYVVSFVVIVLLWFVHHSVFHALQQVNILLHLVNTASLALVGVIPLVSKLLLLHGGDADANDNRAVQFGCLVLFGCGISHFIMWTIAIWNREEVVKPSINCHTPTEVYIIMKTTVLPIVSLVVLFATYGGNHVSYIAFCLAVLFAPVIFAVLNWVSSLRRFRRQGELDHQSSTEAAASDPL